MVLLGFTATVRAQEAGHDAVHRRHPPQDQALHEKFYSTWHMPDNPSVSCCNSADCYPTDIKYIDDQIYARRREDGRYILIPPQRWSETGIIRTAETIFALRRPHCRRWIAFTASR